MVALEKRTQRLRGRAERWTVAVTVALVLELVAGLTSAVALRREASEGAASVVASLASAVDDAATAETAAPAPGATSAAAVDSWLSALAAPAPAASSSAPAASPAGASQPPGPYPAPAPQTPAAPPAPVHAPAAAPQPAPAPPEPRMRAASAETESSAIFREQFPAQAAARQADGDPASFHWAVLVGVNAYQGRTRDTIGSVADAVLLRDMLLARGWRDDHILLLTDGAATHDTIVRGLEWLARSTDERSVAIFSFSGHMRYQKGDPDGDGEARDSGLWPTDNRFIWDSAFQRMIGAVRAARMWISFQGCHSGGMNDPGLEAPNRVITYSSLEREKSYEDPEVGHSVQGWFMFAEGMRDRYGDANKDGEVSVQEAYTWGAPRAHTRTANKQSPQIFDGLGRPFALEIG